MKLQKARLMGGRTLSVFGQIRLGDELGSSMGLAGAVLPSAPTLYQLSPVEQFAPATRPPPPPTPFAQGEAMLPDTQRGQVIHTIEYIMCCRGCHLDPLQVWRGWSFSQALPASPILPLLKAHNRCGSWALGPDCLGWNRGSAVNPTGAICPGLFTSLSLSCPSVEGRQSQLGTWWTGKPGVL